MAYDEDGNLVPDPIPASVVLGEAVSEHPVLKQLKDKVASLEEQLEQSNRSKDYYMKIATERGNAHATMKNALTSILTELYNDDEISQEAARKIAEACDIEITKEITISGSISFSGTVEVSIFEDTDDLRYNVDVDSLDVSAFGNSLYQFDYDLEDVEEA